LVNCTKCRERLNTEIFNGTDLSPCPSCGVLIRVDAFPALFRDLPSGTSGETLLLDDEASCFYHPKKRAVLHCSQCGRFLCALCDMELSGKHLCPSCLEAGKKKKKIRNLENHRILYDSIALSLSILSMLLWFVTFITAPMVIFMVIRYWKTPISIIPRTKVRFIAAFIIAAIQIIGWAAVLYNLVTG